MLRRLVVHVLFALGCVATCSWVSILCLCRYVVAVSHFPVLFSFYGVRANDFVDFGVILTLLPSCPFASVRHIQRCVLGIISQIPPTCAQFLVLFSCLYPLCGAYVVMIVLGVVDFGASSASFAILLSTRTMFCMWGCNSSRISIATPPW